MYDVKVLHLLDKVIESLEVIQQRTENIHCTNEIGRASCRERV